MLKKFGVSSMTRLSFVICLLSIVYSIVGCSGDENSTSNTVACDLPQVNQCFSWINLSSPLVQSLQSTCVNDDNGTVIQACATSNLVGICEQVGDPIEPDLLNHFYLPNGSDPTTYAAAKEQACNDVGGTWVPAP